MAITISAGLAISPGGGCRRRARRSATRAGRRAAPGSSAKAGLDRRVAPQVDEHEREQQQAADRARREEQHPEVRVAELLVGEQPGRDHRVGRAPLPPDERDAEQDRRLHQAEPERQVAAERVGLHERDRQAEDRARRAGPSRARRPRGRRSGPRSPATSATQSTTPSDAERDVDQEDPVPARRPRSRTPPSTGPSADDTSATTAISARPRPRCSGGNTSTVIAKPSGARMPAPTPWITRKHDQPLDRPGRGAERRADREDRQADDEEALAAELVRQPAHRHQQDREDDVVGVDDPGHRRHVGRHLALRARGSRCSRSRRPAGPSPSRSSSRRRSATCSRRGTRTTGWCGPRSPLSSHER